jgi:hypothetical protein
MYATDLKWVTDLFTEPLAGWLNDRHIEWFTDTKVKTWLSEWLFVAWLTVFVWMRLRCKQDGKAIVSTDAVFIYWDEIKYVRGL